MFIERLGDFESSQRVVKVGYWIIERDDVFAALVAEAAAGWGGGEHGFHVESVGADVAMGRCRIEGVGGLVPGSDVRDWCGRGAAATLAGGGKGGGAAKDGFQVGVDGGLDVDGVSGGFRMHEGDVDAQGGAKHGCAGTEEVGGVGEGGSPGFVESEDFDEEDDVFAVELHAGGVYLEAVVAGVQAFVKGFHRVHLAALGAGGAGDH